MDISGEDVFSFTRPLFAIAIVIFFLISGFLITGSYLRTPSLKKFFEKRARRLLPLYVLVILLCTFSGAFISTYSFHDYFTSPQLYSYLLANFSFLNFLEPCLPGVFTSELLPFCSVNGALWTLKIEIAFYLTVPIILYFVSRMKRKYILLGIFYVLGISYRAFFIYYYEKTGNPIYEILSRQYPTFLSYFSIGIALYYYFDIFIKKKWYFFIAGVIIIICEGHLNVHILYPFGIACILFTIAYSIKSLNNFGKQTDASYGVYIFHFPIISYVTSIGLFKLYNPYVVALSIIFVVLLIGFLSWNLIEKRFLKR